MYFAGMCSDGVWGVPVGAGVSSEGIAETDDEPLRVGASKIYPLLPI
jgi:hypothetical protein